MAQAAKLPKGQNKLNLSGKNLRAGRGLKDLKKSFKSKDLRKSFKVK